MYVHTCTCPEEFPGPNCMCNFDEYCQIAFHKRYIYYFPPEMYTGACFFTEKAVVFNELSCFLTKKQQTNKTPKTKN